MILPTQVREHLEEMTDDEVVAAFVADGHPEAYARACLVSLRNPADAALRD